MNTHTRYATPYHSDTTLRTLPHSGLLCNLVARLSYTINRSALLLRSLPAGSCQTLTLAARGLLDGDR